MKILYSFLLFPFFSCAFSVDSMIKFSGEDDFFLVNGNSKEREYIYVTLSELISEKNNRRDEIFYNADNVPLWPISAEPTDIIISSGEQVKIKINKNYTPVGGDRIFCINFSPDTLNDNDRNQYNIPFGYKAWLIVPGTESESGTVDVSKVSEKNKYIIKNNTNKVMDVWADYCGSYNNNKCRVQLITRPYSEKKIEIDSNNNPIEFTFSIYIGRERKLIKRKIL
ncbi:hypothetical protein EC2747800_3437 [Escherichia coli 2747800]|uniref:hypothetical protein n=1 Tax=Escherichia coli TaxID=562 RepID=UPI0002CB2764|nr:hypothetical protein [Escherichia coli]EMW72913.1 hypothetical protein EC2747800_3437 [Escherichia coli 2747800]